MSFKTPSFWYRRADSKAPLMEIFLQPFAWIYGLGIMIHHMFKVPVSMDIPVICVGNINAGGTGKTPSAIALMALIQDQFSDKSPCFLTRGYGGALRGPALVDPAIHTPYLVGEEALLLADQATTYMAARRLDGAGYAASQGADVIVMDDGFQNRSLSAAANIIVVNGAMGFGNGLQIPAGPLRENLRDGLERADAFVILGDDERGISDILPPSKPVFKATIETAEKNCPPKDKRYLAFAGLGYPQKFFDYARNDLGLSIKATESFADHHAYTIDDIAALLDMAQKDGLSLLTTEKDYQHLKTLDLPKGAEIFTLPISLAWDDKDGLVRFLRDVVEG